MTSDESLRAALEGIDRALARDPASPDILNDRAIVLCQLGRYPDALADFDRALAIRPDFAAALNNRGLALQACDRPGEALADFERAVRARPGYAEALTNRGNMLQSFGRFEEAIGSYDSALAAAPRHAGALLGRGLAHQMLNRLEEALASYELALEVSPGWPEALSNRGNALQALGRYAEALRSFDDALRGFETAARSRADGATLLSNRGNALQGLGRYDDALQSFADALRSDPGNAIAHRNRSLCLLQAGDFERGWPEYEWRWLSPDFQSTRYSFAQPAWRGRESLAGKSLLVFAEQGLGDTLQFVRYVPRLAQAGARVLLLVQPELKTLLSALPGANRVISPGEALPPFDFHCPFLSLPLACRTRLETIPREVPYLSPAPASLEKWRARLGTRTRRRVGIAWSGQRAHVNDRNRSIPLARLSGLAALDLALVSLQKEVRPEDAAALAANPRIAHPGAELVDMADTAALIAHLDLVVCVDTAVAHLAGALAKPVWILLPHAADWRWLAEREDSPWYPTARLFRQPAPGDWDSVIARVRRELERA